MEEDIEGEKGGARPEEKRRPVTKVNEVETEGENWRKIDEKSEKIGEKLEKIGEK